MHSRQQKSAKKGSERYLMFGPNHILVTLRWDDGRCPGQENICRWFLNGYKSLLGPSKLRNHVYLGKYSKWNLNFQNWSKSLCVGVSEPTRQLLLREQHTLCVTGKVNRHLSKKMKNKKKEKKENRNLNL